MYIWIALIFLVFERAQATRTCFLHLAGGSKFFHFNLAFKNYATLYQFVQNKVVLQTIVEV